MSPERWLKALDEWRSTRHYSLKDLARHLDRPVETVRRWFSPTGGRIPSKADRDSIAELIGLYSASERYSSRDPVDILNLEWTALKRQYCWASVTNPEQALTWMAAIGLKVHAALCKKNIPIEMTIGLSQKPVLYCADFRGYKAVLEIYPKEGSLGARYGLEAPDRPAELHSDIEVDDGLVTTFTEYCHEHLQFYTNTGERETSPQEATGTGRPKVAGERSVDRRGGDTFANRDPGDGGAQLPIDSVRSLCSSS